MPELQDDHTGLQGVSVLRKTLGSNPEEWNDRQCGAQPLSGLLRALRSQASVSLPQTFCHRKPPLATSTPKRKGLGHSFWERGRMKGGLRRWCLATILSHERARGNREAVTLREP